MTPPLCLDTPTGGRVLSRRCRCATGASPSGLVADRAQGLRPFAPPRHGSMAQDLNTARRAEHTVARCTTYLLFACLLLEAGTLASTFSHRAELRLTSGEPLLPGAPAESDARGPAITRLKMAA